MTDDLSHGLFGLTLHRVDPGPAGLVIGFSRPAQHAFPASVDALCDFLGNGAR